MSSAETRGSEQYAAAICTGAQQWRERLRHGLESSGVKLAEGGALVRTFHGAPLTVGSWRLLDPDEARRAFPGAAWLDWKPGCPFVEPVRGYLVWSHHLVWSETPATGGMGLIEVIGPVVREARGMLARLSDGRIAESVRPRSFALADLLDRFGFEDGDGLLERAEGDYARHAIAACDEELRKAGLTGQVQWVPTSHNALRLAWNEQPSRLRKLFKLQPKLAPALFHAENQRLVRHPSLELAGKRVELWAYDFSVLADRGFWTE